MNIDTFKTNLLRKCKQIIVKKETDIEQCKENILNRNDDVIKTTKLFTQLQKIIKSKKLSKQVNFYKESFSISISETEDYKENKKNLQAQLRTFKEVYKLIPQLTDLDDLKIIKLITLYEYNWFSHKRNTLYINPNLINPHHNIFIDDCNTIILQIQTFPIIIGYVSFFMEDMSEQEIRIFGKVPYNLQVNHISNVLKQKPDTNFSWVLDCLPKKSKIAQYLQKLAVFS